MKTKILYSLLITDDGIQVDGVYLPKDMAVRIHAEVAAMGWCDDTDCPCYQHGAEAERDGSHEA